MRIAAVLGSLASILLLSNTLSSHGQQVLLTDDAAINSSSTSTNYGGSTSLTINSTNSVLLQFDLADILPTGVTASQVNRARLILFPNKVTTTGTFNVYGVTGSWTETSVTYATRPAVSASSAGTGTAKLSDRPAFVAVTGLIQGWISDPSSNHGVEVKATGSTSFIIDSKESTATSHSAILQIDLNGPAGATGATGPTGPIGPAGATGSRGPAGTVTLPYSGSAASDSSTFFVTNQGSGVAIKGVGGNDEGSVIYSGGVGLIGAGGPASRASAVGGDGGDFFGGEASGSGGLGGNGVVAAGGDGVSGGIGIYAIAGRGADAYAGSFVGDVYVDGHLTQSSESFKIDNPLDPEGKYLYHSSVESPDMKNVYDGVTVTDGSGIALVTLPDWFDKLNRDFRYQLTTIGPFAQATIETEISSNHFTIRTDRGGVKVSWQVTGIRQDAWADAHRIPVEVEKIGKEKGHYIHPELFGHAGELNVEEVAHPRAIPMQQQPQ